MVLLAGGSPAATHFLCFAKESKQRKATRLSGSLRCAPGNLCCAQKAGVRPNSLHYVSLKQCAALIPLFAPITGPARTGLAGSGSETQDRKPNTKNQTQTNDFGIWMSGCSAVRSHPLWRRRGAQLQADQGRALSEV